MKILVTGSSGFIGSHVVREAFARGHAVVGLSRSAPSGEKGSALPCSLIHHDLVGSAVGVLDELGIDAVIHLAAGLNGVADEQYRNTVQATRHLLSAMRRAGVRKLIGVSSMAVIDYRRIQPFSEIDEDAATADGRDMGTYTAMKLLQERLFSGFAAESGGSCTILRPGLVYDDQHLLAAHAGVIKGPLRLLAAHDGRVPTVAVGGLARALVDATERDFASGEVIHLVDDNLPRQGEYLAELRRRGALPAAGTTIPWWLLAVLAAMVRGSLGAVGQGHRIPEVALRHAFAARLKPYHYSNAKARRLLGWVPGCRFA